MIAAVFILGIAVGCSQLAGATPIPGEVAPSVAATVPANVADPTPPAVTTRPNPTAVSTIPSPPAASTIPNPPAASTESRRRPPSGRGFVPLDDPVFLAADESEFADDELVLGVEWAGEVRAYPVRMLRYHHVINDSVDGSPLLITY